MRPADEDDESGDDDDDDDDDVRLLEKPSASGACRKLLPLVRLESMFCRRQSGLSRPHLAVEGVRAFSICIGRRRGQGFGVEQQRDPAAQSAANVFARTAAAAAGPQHDHAEGPGR